MRSSCIGGRNVTIEEEEESIVWFSGGKRGHDESGPWSFWKANTIVTRSRPGKDPGKRFGEMKNRPQEKDDWEKARLAQRIKPAQIPGIKNWLNRKEHVDDAKFAIMGWIGGRNYSVEKNGGKYELKRTVGARADR